MIADEKVYGLKNQKQTKEDLEISLFLEEAKLMSIR
jgi:hypothetical protein